MITELLPRGRRVLCAVSGGADSMALLHMLLRREDLTVCAAHFEHGLRGEESLRDAAFVEDWCRERSIPFLLEHGDVRAYASERGLGIEEAARELRYAFLERAADQLGCELIATAHNADDNAETMLLHLLRGSGLDGLRGIPRRRGRLVRPLLDMSRAEIERYLEENGALTVIDYKTDAVRSRAGAEKRGRYYAGQLRSYAAALRRITGKPVKECLLYFLAVDEIVAVEI